MNFKIMGRNVPLAEPRSVHTSWLLGCGEGTLLSPALALFWEAGTSQWRISPRYEEYYQKGLSRRRERRKWGRRGRGRGGGEEEEREREREEEI